MHVFLPIMSDVIHIQIGYSPLGQINLPGYEQKSLALHFEKKQADNVADTQSDTETDSNLVALRVKPHLDQKQVSRFAKLLRCLKILKSSKTLKVSKRWKAQRINS